MVHGTADSDAVKGLGKPCDRNGHARIDERGLETGHGLGTAAPAARCVDSAGLIGYRASPRLCVEALLAAAASSASPPIDDLLPDRLLLRDDELPEDLPWLLRLLPRADV